jgi:hypothetical protein
MADIEIEIEGPGAIAATEELMHLEGLNVVYETEGEDTKKGLLATIAIIATVTAITADTLEIATKLYKWIRKYFEKQPDERIEKAVLVGRNGRKVLLVSATVEQIKQLLDDK